MATATQAPPRSAHSHYLLSALVAQRAVAAARRARPRGFVAVARAIATHQVTQATLSERAVAEMLTEQGIDVEADAILNSLIFTTEAPMLEDMLDSAGDSGFGRLVESLVQDAGRAAESVATAVRPNIYHVRYLTPPSCARCAVLAGRVYRYSEGFLRHPNCDCVMIPTTVAAPFAQDPESMFEQGNVTGLSKADQRAIRDGADIRQVVNVRRRAAGLTESGRVLARAGRPTPEGIYRMASDRDQAVELLAQFGYVST